MNHPPIPLNSEYFKVLGESFLHNTGKAAFLPAGGGYHTLESLHLEGRRLLRYTAACIAEVEWRKRAERWLELEKKATQKGAHLRACEYLNSASVEWGHAEAWRAWGSTK